MVILVGAVAWLLGAGTAWAFFRGADLVRRRDEVLGRGVPERPGVGEDCSGDWDYDCETGWRQR